MLSIDYIKQHKEKLIIDSERKGYPINKDTITKILKKEEERINLINKIQEINRKRNVISVINIDDKSKKQAKELRIELHQYEEQLKKTTEELNVLKYSIPNLSDDESPIGKDESSNKTLEFSKIKPRKFGFKIKDHLNLGESLGIIDLKKAAKISGTGFAYLVGKGALLEIALINFVFNNLEKEGFIPVIPPVLINKDITKALGYWQGGEHEEYYWVLEDKAKNSGYYLIGTAEHSLVPMYKDDVLNLKDLPKRYVGFSTAFRRERGSYGKYTKGIFRMHQFDKLEMISFVKPSEDQNEHKKLLEIEKNLFNSLEIPYRVILSCKGELGFPIAKKYDIESWFPSLNEYKELTSVSTTTDFQSRRLNIKYQDGQKKEFVHILNGTAFAIGRTIIAILENFQQKDGSVQIPKILHKYTGFTEIKPKS